METVVLLGAGQMGKMVQNLISPNHLKLLAVGDNNPALWDRTGNVPICPVEEALRTQPDCVFLCVWDRERAQSLAAQARAEGYQGPLHFPGELLENFDLRSAIFQRLSDRLERWNVPGALAELGTYKGDFAWQLNQRFPQRDLYLFDTFSGFDEHDIHTERQLYPSSRTSAHDFSDTQVQKVVNRMPYPQRIIVRQGFFPETAVGLEDVRYALVSLDADLFAPTLAGLRYFYPRLSPGGALLLHDYNSAQFPGAKDAVNDFEKEFGPLTLLPLCDLHGTAVILKPFS